MLKIALSGCCGRMGHVINDIVSGREGMEIRTTIKTKLYN